MPYALLLFVAMPIIEIALLLRVGDAIGWLPTLAIVILTAFLGTAMLRQQGLATLNKARQRLDAGEMPAQQMLEGVLLLIGGILLLTPGFVTDAFGFACLVPASRHWLARRIAASSTISVGGFAGFAGGSSARATRVGPAAPGSSTTVGSGSTPGARQSTDDDSGWTGAGGRPQPDATPTSRANGSSTASTTDSGEVIDAEYKRLDD